jgi:predicted  nucleic acid-binding Zn-ribbon protein
VDALNEDDVADAGRGDEVDGEVERQQMEKELREMRSQLLAVNSQRDVDRLQQELEKSEQQRAQLSDHIQVIDRVVLSDRVHVNNGKIQAVSSHDDSRVYE